MLFTVPIFVWVSHLLRAYKPKLGNDFVTYSLNCIYIDATAGFLGVVLGVWLVGLLIFQLTRISYGAITIYSIFIAFFWIILYFLTLYGFAHFHHHLSHAFLVSIPIGRAAIRLYFISYVYAILLLIAIKPIVEMRLSK